MLTFHSRQLRHHFLHFARAFHHLAHLIKAPQQIVHLRDSAAAAARDALTPPCIQNVGARPLFVCHRKHNSFRALELLLVNREALHVTHAGQHAKNILQWTHLPEHFELREEIIEIERSTTQFALERGRIFAFHRFSSFLDETDDVAHSENPAREPLRNKDLELVKLFTRPYEFDRTKRHLSH